MRKAPLKVTKRMSGSQVSASHSIRIQPSTLSLSKSLSLLSLFCYPLLYMNVSLQVVLLFPIPRCSRASLLQIQKRSKVKPFLKLVNYSHVMPTRYSVDAAMQFKDT